jgi:UDP-glucose 4-epimerase
LLLDSGVEVSVLDTLDRGHAAAVDARATLVVGSVADPRAVDDALEGCSAVMHFAGYTLVEESVSRPEAYFANNTEGPATLLDAACERKLSGFVFSSTAAVYGQPVRVPITEEDPTAPVNPYGESKLRFEEMLAAASRSHGMPAFRLRYFNVAGAHPDGMLGEDHEPETHIVPRILSAMRDGQAEFEIFGGDYPTADGTCVRDYVHVLDLAQAHLRALERLLEGHPGGAVNLGSGGGYSNHEVVSACAEVTGVDVQVNIGPRRAGDPATLVASVERARDVLGWRPQRDLREMVADAWRWHVANPNGYR